MNANAPIVLHNDELYPRDEAHRFRLYALEPNGQHVVRAAGGDACEIGLALVTIALERRDAGLDPEIVAVYDAIDRKWLTTLWAGRS